MSTRKILFGYFRFKIAFVGISETGNEGYEQKGLIRGDKGRVRGDEYIAFPPFLEEKHLRTAILYLC
jgi:hypothetical protein